MPFRFYRVVAAGACRVFVLCKKGRKPRSKVRGGKVVVVVARVGQIAGPLQEITALCSSQVRGYANCGSVPVSRRVQRDHFRVKRVVCGLSDNTTRECTTDAARLLEKYLDRVARTIASARSSCRRRRRRRRAANRSNPFPVACGGGGCGGDRRLAA